jgi:hypothetical protein
MYWDQLARSLKQFIARTASPLDAAAKTRPQDLESVVASDAGDEWNEAEEMTPYAPDDRGERCDSSLHLSC